MPAHKILNILTPDISLREKLSKELKISSVLAQVLINRGIKNAKEADEFLNIKLDSLLDPYFFADMEKAVSLIKKAGGKKEKILICGDYDVDGITSVAILKDALKRIGVETLHYIPHRVKEGYGLNKNILQIAKDNNVKFLITADCGISSHEEVAGLRRMGAEIIITDHHQPADAILPEASAIINPKVKGCKYGYKDLAGVGVAYKLCQALTGDKLVSDLDLVSLGTIADVVPLRGENRVFAKEGLACLTRGKRIGIKALIDASRIGNREINSTFVSYILGPRINASGRVDTADISLALLLSQDKQEADELAKSIEAHNRQRQKIEGKIMEEAQAIIDREVNFKEHKVIVIAKEGWHQGVLGIVASKLADKFYRPTIVISLSDDLCKGSGRSIKNFHLFSALNECKKYLHAFGGHGHAVGLVVRKDNIKDFRKEINRLAHDKLRLDDLLPSLDVDMELGLEDLSEELIAELERLEPFGTGNPEPLFFTRGLKLKSEPVVLSRDTLKFWINGGKVTYPVIGFGMGSFKESLIKAGEFDLAYTPRMDTWQDNSSVILEAKEIILR